ncbi:MAG: hypothetical protein ACOCUI_03365 [bacterium]
MSKILVSENGKYYGDIGKITPFKINGQHLHVGDVVELFYNIYSYGKSFICWDEESGYFIWGIAGCCDNKSGKIINGWKIKIIKKYYDVNSLEKYDGKKIISINKPPLGIISKGIFEQRRIQDICKALADYSKTKLDSKKCNLMIMWAEEMVERLDSLKYDLENKEKDNIDKIM